MSAMMENRSGQSQDDEIDPGVVVLGIALWLMEVDKQTKGSYKTPEAAQSAASEIKIAARRGLVLFFLASHAAAPILHSRYGARS
jgi:hypothetical protein